MKIPGKIHIKVYVEIDPEKAQNVEGMELKKKLYEKWLEQGLKAQLNVTSMVTGKLYVDLDFYPEYPVEFVGLDKRFKEIPSIPTDMELLEDNVRKFLAKFEDLPFREIVENMNSALAHIDSLAGSPDLKNSVSSLGTLLTDMSNATNNLNSKIGNLMDDLSSTTRNINVKIDGFGGDFHNLARSAQSTFEQVNSSMGDLDQPVKELMETLNRLSDSAKGTFEQTKITLESVQNIVDERSPVYRNINDALRELSLAMRSLRQLSDYLEQHPEALLRGKGK